MKRTAGAMSAASQVTRWTAVSTSTKIQMCKVSTLAIPPNVGRSCYKFKDTAPKPGRKGVREGHAHSIALRCKTASYMWPFAIRTWVSEVSSRYPTWDAQLGFIKQDTTAAGAERLVVDAAVETVKHGHTV